MSNLSLKEKIHLISNLNRTAQIEACNTLLYKEVSYLEGLLVADNVNLEVGLKVVKDIKNFRYFISDDQNEIKIYYKYIFPLISAYEVGAKIRAWHDGSKLDIENSSFALKSLKSKNYNWPDLVYRFSNIGLRSTIYIQHSELAHSDLLKQFNDIKKNLDKLSLELSKKEIRNKYVTSNQIPTPTLSFDEWYKSKERSGLLPPRPKQPKQIFNINVRVSEKDGSICLPKLKNIHLTREEKELYFVELLSIFYYRNDLSINYVLDSVSIKDEVISFGSLMLQTIKIGIICFVGYQVINIFSSILQVFQ